MDRPRAESHFNVSTIRNCVLKKCWRVGSGFVSCVLLWSSLLMLMLLYCFLLFLVELWGLSRHLGSLTTANWVSFDFNVSWSSCWGQSLIKILKSKKKSHLQKFHLVRSPQALQLRSTPCRGSFIHRLDWCQGWPVCGTCTALHRRVALGTVWA